MFVGNTHATGLRPPLRAAVLALPVLACCGALASVRVADGQQAGPGAGNGGQLQPPPADGRPPVSPQPPPTAPPRTAPPQPPPRTAPPPAVPPTLLFPRQQPPRPFGFGSFLSANRGTSLARTPAMFGDSLFRGGTITATEALTGGGSLTLVSDMPLAAGTPRVLIAEHNKALPTDRFYFNYNDFHNAFQSRVWGNSIVGNTPFAAQQESSISRYLLGVEKTFAYGACSVELRLPLAGRYNFQYNPGIAFGEQAAVSGGRIGNLAVIFKGVLLQNPYGVLSAGLGIDTPTGADARATTTLTQYTIRNQAAYLLPYVAVMRRPSDNFFWHGFAQLDVATGGNTVRFDSRPPDFPAAGVVGKLTGQTLMHVDLGGGAWLIRRPGAPLLTGVAAFSEAHYTSTLQRTDVVAAGRQTIFYPGATLDVRNPANWMNVVNVTSGVHVELLNDSTLRVAGAFPLTQRDNRFFDGELLVQFGQRF